MQTQQAGAQRRPSYFLVSVSSRENLELCTKYALAGFPGGASGAWTYCEIETGDFVSFLYGAKAYNLYAVASREALRNADVLPPWRPLVFKESGRKYFFPFRLQLRPIRQFEETLVRPEFAYVAENLLLRGGYRRTHFQADQTTLQSVSQMGKPFDGPAEELAMPHSETFIPSFTRNKDLAKPPEVFKFQEAILQAAIRRYMRDDEKLQNFLRSCGLEHPPATDLEILGEKALMQGHVDLLIKERAPMGHSPRIPVEVKARKASSKDLAQLRGYMDELDEVPTGMLIASDFTKDMVSKGATARVRLVKYNLRVNLSGKSSFNDIFESLSLEPLAK